MVTHRGDLDRTLHEYADDIRRFRPDILGMGFFSIHYMEVQKLVQFSRGVCKKAGLKTTFIAGGIHASTEPALTLKNLEFDYVFIGEAEISLAKFCDGADPRTIPGVLGNDLSALAVLSDTHASQPAHLGTLTYGSK